MVGAQKWLFCAALAVLATTVSGLGSGLFEDSLCGCEDATPLGGFECEEQALFGKCSAEWMISGGYCLNTCDRCFCVGDCICIDIPSDENFTCAQQQEFGQCDAQWMIDNRYCEFTCGRCSCLSLPSISCMQYALNDLTQARQMVEILNGSPVQQNLLNSVADQPATYFIPNNRAWGSLRESIPNADLLFENQLLLSEIIAYHIVSGSAGEISDLVGSEVAVSSHLNEEFGIQGVGRRGLRILDKNGREANVVSGDLDTCGSTVHVVDNVLIPSQTSYPFQCLQFALGSSDDTLGMLEIINSYPKLQELLQQVSQEPRTYFIPSTSAWDDFRASLHMPELLFDEEDLLLEFISLHVLVDAGELEEVEGEAESLHLGEELDVNSLRETVRAENGPIAQITRKNIKACNSVINVIDKVLTPTTTSEPFLCLQQALGSRSETASLINLSDISNILQVALQVSAATPSTYFIPSTDAWLNLLNNMEVPATLLESDELLAEIVSYHISQDSMDINDLLFAGNVSSNHLGEMLQIMTSDGPEAILLDSSGREALVTSADTKVCNSTINVIDRVLIPSTTSVPYECMLFAFETIPGVGEFSNLIQDYPVLQDFVKEISSSLYTFLLPSNTAIEEFNALLKNEQVIDDNPVVLEELIRFHIVKGSLNTQQLFEGGDIETLLFEEPVEFEFASNFDFSKRQPLDRTSAIIMPDIDVCNTTVHIIDHMLYPAITSIQDLLNIEGGIFRSLVEIPNEPLITFGTVEQNGDDILGEEFGDEDDLLSPLPESIMEIDF